MIYQLETQKLSSLKSSINKIRILLFGLIYRPPGNPLDTFLDDLDAYIYILLTENKHIYLMGDFNIDLLSTTQTHGQRLKNLLYTYALHPHIDKPTRITNTSSTLIDNIFSNNFSNETTNGILYYDISDHLPIFMINHKVDISKETNVTLHHKTNKKSHSPVLCYG